MIKKIFNRFKNSMNRELNCKLDTMLFANAKQLSIHNKELIHVMKKMGGGI